jgi:hypothetical protein
MPKRAYLEGDKGVEVVELKQFGHRMGMTDQGEFVHDVPGRYFLFLSYRTSSSIGGGYGFAGDQLQSLGGSFKVTAKVVDEVELQSLLASAEISLAESCDAYENQMKYKAMAPKEKAHTALGDCDCSQGDSPSTKAAVDVSIRKSDKKLSADKLDEMFRLLVRYKNKAGEGREKGLALADKKLKGKAKVNASMPKHPYMEETVEEGRMPASVIKHKQRIANMTPEEKAKKFAGKSEEQLKSMARRHGYGKDSNEYSKHVKEEQIDEVKSGQPSFRGDSTKRARRIKTAQQKAPKDPEFWKKVDAANKKRETQIDEKAPPGAKFERMVKHIKKGYAKDGELTKKEKGIAFATAWKAKKKEQD